MHACTIANSYHWTGEMVLPASAFWPVESPPVPSSQLQGRQLGAAVHWCFALYSTTSLRAAAYGDVSLPPLNKIVSSGVFLSGTTEYLNVRISGVHCVHTDRNNINIRDMDNYGHIYTAMVSPGTGFFPGMDFFIFYFCWCMHVRRVVDHMITGMAEKIIVVITAALCRIVFLPLQGYWTTNVMGMCQVEPWCSCFHIRWYC